MRREVIQSYYTISVCAGTLQMYAALARRSLVYKCCQTSGQLDNNVNVPQAGRVFWQVCLVKNSLELTGHHLGIWY